MYFLLILLVFLFMINLIHHNFITIHAHICYHVIQSVGIPHHQVRQTRSMISIALSEPSEYAWQHLTTKTSHELLEKEKNCFNITKIHMHWSDWSVLPLQSSQYRFVRIILTTAMSLRAGHQANGPAVRMIFLAWFDYPGESPTLKCMFCVIKRWWKFVL